MLIQNRQIENLQKTGMKKTKLTEMSKIWSEF